MQETELTIETPEFTLTMLPFDDPESTPLSARDSSPGLPELPQITVESPRAEGHTHSEPCPSPVVPIRSDSMSQVRIPQFRQSRRWARMYGWTPRAETEAAPPLLDPEGSAPSGYPCPTVMGSDQKPRRELSSKQYCGLPRTMNRTLGRPKIERKNSDASSSSHNGGLCVHSAAYYWQRVKPFIGRAPHTGLNRRSQPRKATPKRRQEPAGQQTSALISILTNLRRARGRGSKMKVEDHKTYLGQSETPRTQRGLQSCLDRGNNLENEPGVRTTPTASSIPSLHNPTKNKRFSDECRNSLKNWKSDNDRFLPTTSTIPAVVVRSSAAKVSFESPQTSGEASRKQASLEATSSPLPPSQGVEARIALLDSASTAALSSHPPQSRELVAQAPGETPGGLSSLLRTTQAEPPPFTSSPTIFPGSNTGLWSENGISSLQARPAKPVMRLSSARSVMSADTLIGIEAQVQRTSQYIIDVDVKQNGSSNPGNRYSGPPPNIPLPALPPEAQNVQLGVAQSSEDLVKLDSGTEESPRGYLNLVRHVIRGTRADKVRERRMRDLDKSRHQLRTSGVFGANETSKKSLDSKISPAITYNIDELDQFPSVPVSRATSVCCKSTSRPSRQHSPGKRARQHRQMSKARSNEKRWSMPPQTLSQSNIFVVVDTDPVTARFRAGAVSPRLSIAGSVTGWQSPENARTSSKLKEVMANRLSLRESPRREIMLRSPLEGPSRKVRGSSRTEKQVLKPRRSRSCSSSKNLRLGEIDGRSQSRSSDDQSLTSCDTNLSNKLVTQERKRRRWNNGDISLVKKLQRDLHDYYTTILMQDEKIRSQANQIQTMLKIFAPLNQFRCWEEPSLLQSSVDQLSISRDENPSNRQARRSWSGFMDRRSLSSNSRSPLDSINERTRTRQAHSTSNKTEAPSKASGSASMSMALSRASADNASLTGPEIHRFPVGKQGGNVVNGD